MFLALFISSAVFAQSPEHGSLTGIVTDGASGKPASGVSVLATSDALLGRIRASTDDEGVFRLEQLPAGSYTLVLQGSAFKPYSRSGIHVRTGQLIRLNVQLISETVEGESVTVVGPAPSVDVGSSTTGMNVTPEFIARVPFLRPGANGLRSFESVASLSPQVAADAYGFGFSGTTSPENGFSIDGVNVNNPLMGINGAMMPVEFIQDINIITGGSGAEFGGAAGGGLSVMTKSGSNEFHGSVFANYTPGLLALNSPNSRLRNWNIVDFGAEVGGPVLKDALWFYVGVSSAFNRQRERRNLNTYAIEVTDNNVERYARNADGSFQITPIEGFEQNRFDDHRGLFYIAKLTYLINEDHRVALSVNGGAGERHLPAFGNRLAGATFTDSNLITALKYSGAFFDRRLLLDATGGWFHQSNTPYGLPDDGSAFGESQNTKGAAGMPAVTLTQNQPLSLTDLEDLPAHVREQCAVAPGSMLTPCPVTGGGLSYTRGGFGLMQQNKMDRVSVGASATALLSALGHHAVKVGFDFNHAVASISRAYSGGASVLQAADGASFSDEGRFAVLKAPDDLLTIPITIRTPSSNQWGLFVQDSWSIMDLLTLNAGVRYDSQVLFNGNGSMALALNNMWSPRVGLVYDFTRHGRSKMFANFAQYYQSMPLSLADVPLTGERQVSISRALPCDPSSDPSLYNSGACVDRANFIDNGSTTSPSRYATVRGSNAMPVASSLRAQSKNEIVVGAEYELVSNLRVGASYTRSWMVGVVESMSNDEGKTFFIGNPEKVSRNYDAVTAMASKAFADGWVAQVSYTWSSLRGNWAGMYRPQTGQLSPGANADFDSTVYSVNTEGPLPQDRTHSIKAYGAKTFQLSQTVSLLLGVAYEGVSGTPFSYLGSDGQAYVLRRGAAGRTPWVHVINLKAGADYRISKDNMVELTVDAMNVPNLAAATAVDERYTTQRVLPYVLASGESPGDGLSKVTVIDANGMVSNEPLKSNTNFGQPTQYQLPLQIRFGMKLSF